MRLFLTFAKVVPACLILGSLGCADLVSGKHEQEARFTVGPAGDKSYAGWSEITVGEDVNSAGRSTVFAATMELEDPAAATDMTFIQDVIGEAVTGETRTLMVKKSPVPANTMPVAFDIVHTDDIRPLFRDGHTIRIEWEGQTNPSFTAWPPDGIGVKIKIGVEIE
jgi:hypothetical protein